jgi:hypothetical protein
MNEEQFCQSLLATPFLLKDYLLSKGYNHKPEVNRNEPPCHRCKKTNKYFTVSRYNTDCICESCDKKEKSHPEYETIKTREFYACKIGLMNYCQPLPKDKGE